LIVRGALSTRVTYKHLELACELAVKGCFNVSHSHTRPGSPTLSLLERCLHASENLLNGDTKDFERDAGLAQIAHVLTAASGYDRAEEKRSSYALAALHFVERTLGLTTRAPRPGKRHRVPGRMRFCLERRRARECGTYSTPDFIVQSMLGELFFALEQDKEEFVDVMDLSIEGGHFPLAMRRWAARKREVRFYGVDQDPVAVELTTRIQRFALLDQGDGGLVFTSSCQDGLLDPLPPKWPRQYAVVVGNPPWIARKSRVTELLRKKFWPLLRGHYDIYLAFMLRAHELLKPGGYLSYVVPSGFLSNCTAAPIRRLLLEQYDILSLTTYPQRSFIEVPCIIPISFLARKKHRPSVVVACTRITNEEVGLGGPNRPRGSTTVRIADIWKRLPDCVINPLIRHGTEFLVVELPGVPLGSLGKVSSGARLGLSTRCASPITFQAVHARDLRPFHTCSPRSILWTQGCSARPAPRF
jgi:hypothetical protein